MNFTRTHQKHTRETEGVFLNSGKVMKRIKIISMIAVYHIIKIVDEWGKKIGRENYGKVIEIRNRNKEIIDW